MIETDNNEGKKKEEREVRNGSKGREGEGRRTERRKRERIKAGSRNLPKSLLLFVCFFFFFFSLFCRRNNTTAQPLLISQS